MESDNQTREFRLKGGSTIASYLKRFSATEKVVFGVLAVALIITALIMALRANSYFTSEVPANGGSLHEGLVGLPHTINPILAVTDVDRDISSLVYAGLTRTENGKIVGDLAEKWDVSSDGLTYTFTLKPDLRFQNGSPLTADDIVFTINKIKDPGLKSPRAVDWSGISVQAVDPGTVVFTLKVPMSSFLSNTTIGILPKSIWGNVSDDQFIFSGYNIRPIGAGPYKVGGITSDQGGIPTDYELSSWSGYSGHEAYISTITFTFFPDLDHALTALSNGAIDSLSSIPPAAGAKLASNKGEAYAIDTAPLTRVFGVFLNQNKNTALANDTIREALALSVDRSQIINEVLAGYGVPVNGPVPAASGSSSADVSAALALLSKAGWKLSPTGVLEKKPSKKGQASSTISFTLYTPDSADLVQTANILKNQWAKIGISMNIVSLPPSDLYQSVIRTRNYDALLFGQIVSKPADLYAFWHSSQRLAPGVNVSMYTNSKADKLLDSIRTATSTEAAAPAYNQFIQTIRDDIPAIFLYSPDLIYAVPKSLRGMELGSATTPSDRFQSVTKWYTETQQVWNIFIKKVDY